MEDDLQKLTPILNAFQKLSKNPLTYQRTLDQVDDEFSQLLCEELRSHKNATNSLLSQARRARQTALSIIRPAKTRDELIARIQQACQLTDKQIKLLRRIDLVSVKETGEFTLRNHKDVLLPQAKATLYLFAVGVLFGMAIMSVALEPNPGLWLVIRGIGLGIGIGSVAGFVLGRSYRAYPIVEKLRALEPWLNTN